MKIVTTIILTLISLTSFSQSIESITEKVTTKICDCINDDITAYSEIKEEFYRCYDTVFNQIFSFVDSAEQNILIQQGVLEIINNNITTSIKSDCSKIKKIITAEIENSIEPAAINNENPCPVNFTGKDLKIIKKLEGKIIAFNGLVTKVHFAYNSKPYYQVKLEGGNTIWIASLINSGYEKEGKIIRLLGYVSNVGDDAIAKKYNETDYHILAFAILDLENKKMSLMPGSELQVKEWINGTIPKGER